MKRLLILCLVSLKSTAFIQRHIEQAYLDYRGKSYFNFYQPRKNYWTMGTKNRSGWGRSCDNPDAPRQDAESFCAEISKALQNKSAEYPVTFMPLEKEHSLVYAYTRDTESRLSFKIGFIAYKPTMHEDIVEITHLAVDPSYWRKGIGRMLIDSVTVDSAIANIKKLVISIDKYNNRAACFLIKNGFRYTNDLYTIQDTENVFTFEKNIA